MGESRVLFDASPLFPRSFHVVKGALLVGETCAAHDALVRRTQLGEPRAVPVILERAESLVHEERLIGVELLLALVPLVVAYFAREDSVLSDALRDFSFWGDGLSQLFALRGPCLRQESGTDSRDVYLAECVLNLGVVEEPRYTARFPYSPE